MITFIYLKYFKTNSPLNSMTWMNVWTKAHWFALSIMIMSVAVWSVFAQNIDSEDAWVNVDVDDILIVSDDVVEVDWLVDPIEEVDVSVTTTAEDSSDDTVIGVEPINQLPDDGAALNDDENNFDDSPTNTEATINGWGTVSSIPTNTVVVESMMNDDDDDDMDGMNNPSMNTTTSVATQYTTPTLPDTWVSREALGL